MATIETHGHFSIPRDPIDLGDVRYVLPPDFVAALRFLGQFIKTAPGHRSGNDVDTWVHLTNGALYAFTHNLVVDYEIGSNNLPNLKFSLFAIRALGAFAAPPIALIVGQKSLALVWADGQVFRNDCGRFYAPIWFGDGTFANERVGVFDRYWRDTAAVRIDDATREATRQFHGAKPLAEDVYLDGGNVVSRMSSNKTDWTSENQTPLRTGAKRPMRFERQAFLKMVSVATEVSFETSPVCFKHEHGRGMLVERTLGSDVPEFEAVDA